MHNPSQSGKGCIQLTGDSWTAAGSGGHPGRGLLIHMHAEAAKGKGKITGLGREQLWVSFLQAGCQSWPADQRWKAEYLPPGVSLQQPHAVYPPPGTESVTRLCRSCPRVSCTHGRACPPLGFPFPPAGRHGSARLPHARPARPSGSRSARTCFSSQLLRKTRPFFIFLLRERGYSSPKGHAAARRRQRSACGTPPPPLLPAAGAAPSDKGNDLVAAPSTRGRALGPPSHRPRQQPGETGAARRRRGGRRTPPRVRTLPNPDDVPRARLRTGDSAGGGAASAHVRLPGRPSPVAV